MLKNNWIKGGLLAAMCAVVGAVAGLAGSAAAPSSSVPKPAFKAFRAGHMGMMRPGMRRGDGFGGPPIHAEAVVPKRSGSGFETVTVDSGKLKSQSGSDLTITEGTQTQTYKDATVTIPSGAKIFRNGAKASIGDLKTGDFVRVMSSPERTIVVARDANFRPRFQGGRRGFRYGPGPGGPPPPYGP